MVFRSCEFRMPVNFYDRLSSPGKFLCVSDIGCEHFLTKVTENIIRALEFDIKDVFYLIFKNVFHKTNLYCNTYITSVLTVNYSTKNGGVLVL